MRADPDVIMLGEIRDEETAHIAIEASLTGHLVLSTLHTNIAPETATRLLDMGMDPFNFGDSLLAVLAQRHAVDGRLVMHKSTGCEKCDHTGFKSRAGVHELMVVSRELRRLIQNGARAEALQAAAMKEGMRTLRQDGIEKVLAGQTTIEEVRATSNV